MKFAATITVNLTVVVAEVPPPAPLTVIAKGPPVTVPAATYIVIVKLPLPGIGIGFSLKPTVTPFGMPEAFKVMGESNAGEMVLVIVEVPLEPWATVTAVGEAESVKVAGGATVKLNVAV